MHHPNNPCTQCRQSVAIYIISEDTVRLKKTLDNSYGNFNGSSNLQFQQIAVSFFVTRIIDFAWGVTKSKTWDPQRTQSPGKTQTL